MEPQPHTAPWHTAPPIIRIRVNCSKRKCRYMNKCYCHNKGYRSKPRKSHLVRHHRCGQCRNGYRQCFPNCRYRQPLKDMPVPRHEPPPQYPQHPAATAHGSAPPAASAQLASLTPPAASLPPFRSWGLRAASRAPAASAAAVGGFEPSTQGEYHELVHTSGNAENPEDAAPPRKEQKAKMYEKSPYHHLSKTYLWTCKKDLRGGLSS